MLFLTPLFLHSSIVQTHNYAAQMGWYQGYQARRDRHRQTTAPGMVSHMRYTIVMGRGSAKRGKGLSAREPCRVRWWHAMLLVVLLMGGDVEHNPG